MKDSAKSALRAARGWRLAYIASPYRNYPKGHWPAVVAAGQATAKLMKLGVKCFSPIAHGFPISMYGGIDGTNNEFWTAANAPFIDAAEGLVILELDSWETSAGIIEEIKAFTVAGKPIIHITPADLE